MYQTILTDLEASKIKLTHQRKMVLESICKGEQHFSSDNIRQSLKSSHQEIGLATIYRTLHLFEELNILVRIPMPNGSDMYELRNREHLHMVCKNCHRVVDLPIYLNDVIKKEIHTSNSFNGCFISICSDCDSSDIGGCNE